MTTVDRRLARPAELRALVQVRRPVLDPVDRRLARALSIDELRTLARRRTPRAIFDYVDGGADLELTMARNRAAFEQVALVPTYLEPVADPDPSTAVGGERLTLPLVFGPTGYTRMMHHAGEAAVARVAARNGIPYTLSTVGTSTIEEVVDAAPSGRTWFQLYLTTDPATNDALVDRALAAGVRTIMLTVDTAVAARHLRDIRNGLTIPPTLTPRTLLDMARHPGWVANKLTTPPITFASLTSLANGSVDAVRVADRMFEPMLSLDHLAWLRRRWPHTLLVKGVVSARDARRAVDTGADGVVVSNHGGRQLDRTPATLGVLPEIRAELGTEPLVLLDSGVRHGQDVLAAVALGADTVLVGRAYLYGLMAGGERGVQRAFDILREEYVRSLQLVGMRSTAQLGSHVVR